MAGPRGRFRRPPHGGRRDQRPPIERTPEEELAYAKERALRLLAVRARSRSEILGRLGRAGIDPEVAEVVVTDLERVGLVDDAAFARQLTEHRRGVRLEGDRAARAALRAKGVPAEIVEAVIAEEAGDEDERALALARTRTGRLRGLPPDRALARLVGLLQRRGYGYGIAARAARTALATEAGLDPENPGA